MILGLAGVVAWVLWERWAFAGFGDLSVPYRVTGPFSAMHRGGAFIECYIAVAMPFAAQAVLSASRPWAKAAAGALVVAGSVAMMLTFSRNGYAALGVGMVVWSLMTIRARIHQGRAPAIVTVAVLAAVVIAAWPVLTGVYSRERLARWEPDLGMRVAHWSDALALRDGSIGETIFGAGLGKFPRCITGAAVRRNEPPPCAWNGLILRARASRLRSCDSEAERQPTLIRSSGWMASSGPT